MNYILIAISLTTLTLITGLVFMAIGGKLNQKFSSKLMVLRVFFQALTISIIALVYFLSKGSNISGSIN